jgi:hypothetical protein
MLHARVQFQSLTTVSSCGYHDDNQASISSLRSQMLMHSDPIKAVG